MEQEQPSSRADPFDRGRRAWPGIVLERPAFERYVQERVPDGEHGSLRADDLYIACACAAGDERAFAEFDKHYLAAVGTYLAKTQPSQRLVEEVRQLLRERLFVERKITQYSGRGPLSSWLRVVALRVNSNLRRKERRSRELDDAIPDAAIDPELGVIRARYAQEFKDAMRAAIASLDAEERTLLRLNYLDGLNIDRIAVVFNVSRATIGRRMIAVREKIVDETHRLLRERLGATAEELASLLRVVRSNLDMTLSSVLRDR